MKRLHQVMLMEGSWAVLTFFVTFSIYTTTLAPSVTYIDSGELAAVASTVGIAHPTGYPLFTLLGRIAVMLPVNAEPVLILNILSALFTAVSAGLFFKFAWLVLRSTRIIRTSVLEQPEKKIAYSILVFISALSFSLGSTIWMQSVAVEVYSLQIAMVLLSMYCFLKGIIEQQEAPDRISRWFLLSAFVTGLAFTNHLTIILVIPSMVLLFFLAVGWKESSFVLALRALPLFFAGTSLYLVLPIRSSSNPVLDWGHTAELERLFWHLSGKQYRSWMFSSFESAEKQFNHFLTNFPSEYHLLLLPFIVLGFLKLFNAHKKLFWFFTLSLLVGILYSINYDIHDIDSYFIIVFIVLGIFLVLGVILASEVLWTRIPKSLSHAYLLFILLPFIQYQHNKQQVDGSDHTIVRDYSQYILSSLEPHAVVFSYQWDYFVSASLYYQTVRQQRPDLIIIDKELLRRSWYFIFLQARYPEFFTKARIEIDSFLAELYKFEHNIPYDPRIIESSYVQMINMLIEQGMKTGHVYVGPEIEPEFGSKFRRIPQGMLYKLTPPEALPDPYQRVPDLSFPTNEHRLTPQLKGIFIRMSRDNALYAFNLNQPEISHKWLDVVEKAEPGLTWVAELRRQIGQFESSRPKSRNP